MSFEKKLANAQKELSEKEVCPIPSIGDSLRKAGLKIRPLYYNTFLTNFVIVFVIYASTWGGGMWLMIWSHQGKSIYEAIFISILAGMSFGLFQAFYYKYIHRKNKLTSWDDL